ncbi:uncharacterized protein LOC129793417 [Lutzomyia longipalpis]|nr:uncharacterized protein LOC129793417 [Lutzomyia longipalpis]XP_055689396.1 uncharacterized protein LOC129793417 [Lutzomyia longipalpis]
MEKKEKKRRRARVQRSLSDVEKILDQRYMQKKLLHVLQSTNCSKTCFNDLKKRSAEKFKEASTVVAKNVQEKVVEVTKSPIVAILDAYAKRATAEAGKEACNFELPIILKGLHEIYPLPEMQEQTPLDVRNLYLYLHYLSMGRPPPQLDEGSHVVLREAYEELIEEVNSDASTEIVQQLADMIKNSQSVEKAPSEEDQEKVQKMPDFSDLGFNFFKLPPEMLLKSKDN